MRFEHESTQSSVNHSIHSASSKEWQAPAEQACHRLHEKQHRVTPSLALALLDPAAASVLETTKGLAERSRQIDLLSLMQVVPAVFILPLTLQVVLLEEGPVQRQCILGAIEGELKIVEAAQSQSCTSHRLSARRRQKPVFEQRRQIHPCASATA